MQANLLVVRYGIDDEGTRGPVCGVYLRVHVCVFMRVCVWRSFVSVCISSCALFEYLLNKIEYI